jgi:hypothetical protein
MSDSLVTNVSYAELIAYLDALDAQISAFLDDIAAFAVALQDVVATFQRDQYQRIYGTGGFLEQMEILVANGISAVRQLVDAYAKSLSEHLGSCYITQCHLPTISNVVQNYITVGKMTQAQATALAAGWYFSKAPLLKSSAPQKSFNMAQPLLRRLQKLEATPNKWTLDTVSVFGYGYYNQRRSCQAKDKLILAVPFSSTAPEDASDDQLFLEEYTSGEIYLGNETIIALPVA